MDSVLHQKLPAFCASYLTVPVSWGKCCLPPPPCFFFFHLLLPYSISQVLSGLVIVLTALVASLHSSFLAQLRNCILQASPWLFYL